jgi:hypothetical protein
VVAGATFVLMFLAYGNAYTFGVFFPALSAAFDADRAETALVPSGSSAGPLPTASVLGLSVCSACWQWAWG